MNSLADVDGFKIYILDCVLLGFQPLIHLCRFNLKTESFGALLSFVNSKVSYHFQDVT